MTTPNDALRELEQVVTCKCVVCGSKRDIRQGEVAADEVPMCGKCFMPMVAIVAKTQRKRK